MNNFIAQLWQPILLATALCFIMSALIWMIAPHHKGEWKEPPNVGGLRDLLRQGGIQPGGYTFPHMSDADRKDKTKAAEKMQQWAEGPSGVLYIVPKGPMSMGKMMGQQVAYFLLVNIFLGWFTSYFIVVGTTYVHVFKIIGLAAFMSYFLGSIPESIWFGRPWKSVVLQGIDAALYAGMTAGTFGWLWPR